MAAIQFSHLTSKAYCNTPFTLSQHNQEIHSQNQSSRLIGMLDIKCVLYF